MDTLKILLGATMALLLGAVVVLTSRMNDGVRNAPEEELVAMRRQLTELEAEIERVRTEKERVALRRIAAEPSPTDPLTRGEAQESVKDLQERLAQLEREAEENAERAEQAEKESEFITQHQAENSKREARRMRTIRDAMQMATVIEWVEDPNFGGFAVLKVENADNVQPGVELAIRRNGGILGRLKVTEVTIEGAVATPVTRFDEHKPAPGDELILNAVIDF
jgi:chromosome segregation ATPase